MVNYKTIEESDESDEAAFSISHSAAVKMFDGCLEWPQEQEEATVYTITL